MELNRKLESDLNDISMAVASVEGVVLCVLFGSRARGEYDEYSDYDLLVVFASKVEMWRNLRKLYDATNKTGLFIQAMPVAMEEMEKLDAHFLRTIYEEGLVIYQRYPFTTPASVRALKAMSMIAYRLESLPQRNKLKLEYRLFGRKRGLVPLAGGFKVGRGVVVVPRESAGKVLETLREFGAKYESYDIFVPLR